MISNGVDGVAILESRKKAIKESISEAEDQLSRIEFILSGKEEDTFMNYQASIKELPACTVYSKRMVVPGYDSYFELIPAIGQKVMNKYPDLKCTVPEYCFIIYRDGEYKEKDIDIEITDAAKEIMVKEGYDPVYGARPLKRYIGNTLETMIARRLIAGEIYNGCTIVVDGEDDNISIKVK